MPFSKSRPLTYIEKQGVDMIIHCVKNCIFTVFENRPKCLIWNFQFWNFPPIFVLLKLTCLVTLFDRKLQVFKNSPKWTIFGIFNLLLSTQNVNVARFARNVDWDFFCDFKHRVVEVVEMHLFPRFYLSSILSISSFILKISFPKVESKHSKCDGKYYMGSFF